MKYLIFILMLACTACKSPRNKSSAEQTIDDSESFLDSVRTARQVDSMVKETMTSGYKNVADSSGSWRAPVQVTKAVMVKNDYTSARSVRLSYRNVSDKNVTSLIV